MKLLNEAEALVNHFSDVKRHSEKRWEGKVCKWFGTTSEIHEFKIFTGFCLLGYRTPGRHT